MTINEVQSTKGAYFVQPLGSIEVGEVHPRWQLVYSADDQFLLLGQYGGLRHHRSQLVVLLPFRLPYGNRDWRDQPGYAQVQVSPSPDDTSCSQFNQERRAQRADVHTWPSCFRGLAGRVSLRFSFHLLILVGT